MGLFDYFSRRRERESAIPDGEAESLTAKLQGDGTPIGRPIGQMPPQPDAGQINLGGADLGTIFSMFGQAMKTGHIQFTQGESQTLDLRGTGLADQIRSIMAQHGVKGEGQGSSPVRISGPDSQAVQAQILEALESAGVDVSQIPGGGEITIDPDGDDSQGRENSREL